MTPVDAPEDLPAKIVMDACFGGTIGTSGSLLAELREKLIGLGWTPPPVDGTCTAAVKRQQIEASKALGYEPHENGLHLGIEIGDSGRPCAVVGDESGNEVRVRISYDGLQVGHVVHEDLLDPINRAFAAAMMKYETVAVARE